MMSPRYGPQGRTNQMTNDNPSYFFGFGTVARRSATAANPSFYGKCGNDSINGAGAA